MLPNTRRAGPRPGFTLVELLVVIAIIAVLVTLSMAGVQRARDSAKRLEASTAIGQLDSAISQFKQTYPGARRVPSCGGLYPTGNPPLAGPFRLRSRYPQPGAPGAGTFPLDVLSTSPEAQFFASMFPRMVLDPGTATPIDAAYGNGLPNLDLDPNQCLVFFLGGYFLQVDTANPTTNRRQMWVSGFLTDPVRPFRHDTSAANALAPYGQVPTAVKGPFYQFPANRLDLDMPQLDAGSPPPLLSQPSSPIAQAPTQFQAAPHLLDPWDTPYMYATTATGNNDYIVPGLVVPTGPTAGQPARVPLVISQFLFFAERRRSASETPVALQIKRGGGLTGPFVPFQQSQVSNTNPPQFRYVKEKEWQIVSAGRDQILGGGGLYRGADSVNYGGSDDGTDDLSNFVQGSLGNNQ